MPIEIKELIIRAVVSDHAENRPGQGRGPGPAEGSGPGDGSAPDREALVQECVRQVLKILEAAKER
jgi:hypothetical protein